MKLVVNLHEGQGLGNQFWCIFVMLELCARHDLVPCIANYKNYKGINIIEFDETVVIERDELVVSTRLEPIPKFDLLSGLDYSEFDEKLFLEWVQLGQDIELKGTLQHYKFLPLSIPDAVIFKFQVPLFLNHGCGVHIRGGDYKKTLVWPNKSFYRSALEEINSANITDVFVITDDEFFSNKILPDVEILLHPKSIEDKKTSDFHGGQGIKQDFVKLFCQKYNVITASTFSFWPAYLSKLLFKEEKVVFAPHNWYSNRFVNSLECPSQAMSVPFKFISFKRSFILALFRNKFVSYQLPQKIRRLTNLVIRSIGR